MATAAISGKVGGVYNGAVQLAGFYDWEISYEVDAPEVTDYNSSGWREFLVALSSWNATAARWFQVGQTTLEPGTKYTMRFYLNTDTGLYLTGQALVISRNPNSPVDAPVGDDVGFQGDGSLSTVTP